MRLPALSHANSTNRKSKIDVNEGLDIIQTRRIRKLQELAESCATGISDEIRKDAINELERIVGGKGWRTCVKMPAVDL